MPTSNAPAPPDAADGGDTVRTTLRYSQSTAERIAALAGKTPTAVFLRDLILDALERLENPNDPDDDGDDQGDVRHPVDEQALAEVQGALSRMTVQLDALRQQVAKLDATLAAQQKVVEAALGPAGGVRALTEAVSELLAQIEVEE